MSEDARRVAIARAAADQGSSPLCLRNCIRQVVPVFGPTSQTSAISLQIQSPFNLSKTCARLSVQVLALPRCKKTATC
jgi:hypothetical protein